MYVKIIIILRLLEMRFIVRFRGWVNIIVDVFKRNIFYVVYFFLLLGLEYF